MDCSTPSSSVQGILQARSLEWVTSSSSRGNPLQGSNLCPLHLLHWQVKSLPLSHLGSWWLRKRNDWISTSSSSTCICCLFHYWLGRCQRGGDISNPAGTKILESLGEGWRGAFCRCQYNQSQDGQGWRRERNCRAVGLVAEAQAGIQCKQTYFN